MSEPVSEFSQEVLELCKLDLTTLDESIYDVQKRELAQKLVDKKLLTTMDKAMEIPIHDLCLYNKLIFAEPIAKEILIKHKRLVDWEKLIRVQQEQGEQIQRFMRKAKFIPFSGSRECMDPVNKEIKLREHQKKVVEHMLTHRGLLAIHSTGTGKTLTAVSALNCIMSTDPEIIAYIVTPKSLKANFKKEIKKFGISVKRTPYLKKRVHFETYSGFYNKIIRNEVDCSNAFIIIDEVHNLKAEFRKVESKEGKDKVEGKMALVLGNCAAAAKRVLLLTATPIMNDPKEIKNYMTMISETRMEQSLKSKVFEKDILGDNKMFNRYFCCKVSVNLIAKDENYPTRIDVPNVSYDKNGKPQLILENPNVMVMDPEFYKMYHSIELKKFEEIADGKLSSNVFQNAVRRASVILDGEDSPKVLRALDIIKSDVNKKKKVVVFSQFKEHGLEALRKHLDKEGIRYGLITGDVDEDFRKRFVKKFNKDKIYVLLISKAGGEGLDLQGARSVILFESNWNDSIDQQVIGRAIRYKSHDSLPLEDRNVTIHRLWMVKPKQLAATDKNTIRAVDETLYELSLAKQQIIDKFLKKLEEVSIEKSGCSCSIEFEKPKDAQDQEEKKSKGKSEESKSKNEQPKEDGIISSEFYKVIYDPENEKVEQVEEEKEEEKEKEHQYEAPGQKSSLAIEDLDLTRKQFQKLTGVTDDTKYKEYIKSYKQYLKEKKTVETVEGRRLIITEKSYKPAEAKEMKELEIEEQDKIELDDIFASDSD